MKQVRPPAVAGAFYPAQAQILNKDVDALLVAGQAIARANTSTSSLLVAPKSIIVPHAGYVYSGLTAATAYSELESVNDTIKRVVLLGPVHRVPVRGLALPGSDYFSTPLGEIEIDQQAVELIRSLPQIVESEAAHAQEHSLEVQLPFLQRVLNDFKLIPLAVGDATPQQVAEVLDILWGGDETLIVISSDLSHFLPYQTAQEVDAESVQHILALDARLNHQQACGGTPVNGLLLAAKQHGLKPVLLDLRNSGDATDIAMVDKGRVVGYAAVGFYQERKEDMAGLQ